MSGERKEENAVRTLLFADGTSEGDPVWIQKLLQRRRAALRASRAIWNVLSEARRNNTTRTVLADQLGKLQKKLTADLHLYSPTNIPPEQAIKTEFFGIMDMFAVAGNLWDRYLVERHKGESAKELASTVQSVDSLLRKLEDRLQRNPPAPLVAR